MLAKFQGRGAVNSKGFTVRKRERLGIKELKKVLFFLSFLRQGKSLPPEAYLYRSKKPEFRGIKRSSSNKRFSYTINERIRFSIN